jgi:hypothetical protein
VRAATAQALAAAAVATGLVAWWGPGGGSLRRGSRTLVRGLAPTREARAVLVTLLVAAALSAAGARGAGAGPDTTPLPSFPSLPSMPSPTLPSWTAWPLP